MGTEKRELVDGEGPPSHCLELASEMQAQPQVPDWDQLIANGVVPALILGAERRLRR